MRTILRSGAVALAAGTLLLGSGVAAQAAAPASTVSVSVNRLILKPGEFGHTGSIRIVIKNRTTEVYDQGVTITEPIAQTFDQFTGTGPCAGGGTGPTPAAVGCMLAEPLQPGANAVITVSFRSPAKPQAFPQIAPDQGKVEVGSASAQFDAVFRATGGGLANPVPYVQDTTSKLVVTAGDATLTRQEDGTYRGVTTVTVRNDGDAAHDGLAGNISAPAGLSGWPENLPDNVCFPSAPTVPGGVAVDCQVTGGQLAEGQERTFQWAFNASEDAVPGLLGSATTRVDLGHGPTQTDGANTATFTITVAE
ncbi:hypothetical protein [Actinoplanes sp. HUAS TT8]|uniref:hypothetical protein n=1 Tax=Actinoplanes sp. HUAS TT8 TaxID=3447453 RepID=UPI003F523B34